MTTPLKNWDNIKRTFKFKQVYPPGFGNLTGKPHLGVDYLIPVGTPVYAPLNGTVAHKQGTQAGNYVQYSAEGIVTRILHLSSFVGQPGAKKEGELIGYSGNTGVSTAPHAHIDCSKGSVILNDINNFIDPDKYFKQTTTPQPPQGEYMTEQEYREVVKNVVNGYYLTFYLRQGTDQEIDGHVNAIMGFNPRKFSVSDWVNKQKDEAEFKQKWINPQNCPNIPVPIDTYHEKLGRDFETLVKSIKE